MRKILQDADADRFCKMWRDGVSIESMAATFGLSAETIRKYARERFHLPTRRRACRHSILSDPKKVQFLKLHYSDLGDDVIGLLIGENEDWVRRTARRLGLQHSEQWLKDSYTARAKKTAKTRKGKFARGEYKKTQRDPLTGQFIKSTS